MQNILLFGVGKMKFRKRMPPILRKFKDGYIYEAVEYFRSRKVAEREAEWFKINGFLTKVTFEPEWRAWFVWTANPDIIYNYNELTNSLDDYSTSKKAFVNSFKEFLGNILENARREYIIPDDFKCVVFGGKKSKTLEEMKDIDVICITYEHRGDDLAQTGYDFYNIYLKNGYRGKPIDLFIYNPDTDEIYDSSDMFSEKLWVENLAKTIKETVKNTIEWIE